jgi:hypothetical protein
MSFDDLKSTAISALADKQRQGDWASTGFDKTIARLRVLGSNNRVAMTALDQLASHKDKVVGWGEEGLRSTLGIAGEGQLDEAAEHAALLTAITDDATWEQADDAIFRAAREGNDKKRALDQRREEMKTLLKEIGLVAAKILVALLVAV